MACHPQIDADPVPVYHFDADAVPDPAYHVDADPDPTFQFDADPDPRHCFLLNLSAARKIKRSKKNV
jgi:hypothetical protein